jgi:hypothetical protein
MPISNDKLFSPREHALTVFKHFVAFLEIYGQENYGESAEVNWHEVHSFCHQYHLLDFNNELSSVVYTEDEQEFRDLCFSYIENKILDGYPVWRFFNMSDWLKNKLEQELQDTIIRKKEEFFCKTRCFRCKYMNVHISFICPKDKVPIAYCKDNPYHTELMESNKVFPIFRYGCNKRNQLILEKSNGNPVWMRRIKLDYKLFNKSEGEREWKMNVWKLRNCPYFDEDKTMTFDKYIQENIDLVID